MADNNRDNLIAKAFQNLEPDSFKQVLEADLVIQMLEFCSFKPGADIIIQVKHSDGHTATANLYDHAALVQALYESLQLFIEEMS